MTRNLDHPIKSFLTYNRQKETDWLNSNHLIFSKCCSSFWRANSYILNSKGLRQWLFREEQMNWFLAHYLICISKGLVLSMIYFSGGQDWVKSNCLLSIWCWNRICQHIFKDHWKKSLFRVLLTFREARILLALCVCVCVCVFACVQ